MRFFVLIFILFGSVSAFGQDLKEIEKDLIVSYKRIIIYHALAIDNIENESYLDSALNENIRFRQKLLRYTSQYPATLQYDFPLFDSTNLIISTSKDKKFRVYSWQLANLASGKLYNNVYQYLGTKVNSKCFIDSAENDLVEDSLHDDTGSNFINLFDLNSPKGTIYIAQFNSRGIEGFWAGFKLFQIDGDNLNDTIALIKKETGLQNAEGLNEFSIKNGSGVVSCEKDGKKFKLQIIKENGQATGKWITYKFDGQYFVRTKD